MRKITSILPTNDFLLHVCFETGEQKIFDMKPYLQYPVFASLCNITLFKQAVNHGYFVEWTAIEADLSADTIWHEGIHINSIATLQSR